MYPDTMVIEPGRQTILLGDRPVELRFTRAARSAIERVAEPLTIELELYFSCLIRKRVRFLSEPHADSVARAVLAPNVQLCFRPVMTRACPGAFPSEPELERFPVRDAQRFIPRWLALDHRRRRWSGDFGY